MRVGVSGFQSLKGVDLTVEGLTVIVGDSNTGKSALIRAIRSALFNRSDGYFLRDGVTKADVTLTGAPGGLDIQWTKGKTPAVFRVNGDEFQKVGKGTPGVIQDAGYRSVEIREDATVYPQVAGQFDSLFLLPEAGSVLVDTLAAASKLDLYATAIDLCAADVREAKTRLKITKERVDTLAPGTEALMVVVDEWLARMEGLRVRYDAAQARRAELEAARGHLSRRQAAARVSEPAGPRAMVSSRLREKIQVLRQLKAARQVKAPAAFVATPAADRVKQVMAAVKALVFARRLRPSAPPPALPAVGLSGLLDITGRRLAVQAYLDAVKSRKVRRQEVEMLSAEEFAAQKALTVFGAQFPACATCGAPMVAA